MSEEANIPMYFREGAIEDLEEMGLRSYFANKINPTYKKYQEATDPEEKKKLNAQLWEINSEYFELVWQPIALKRVDETLKDVAASTAVHLLAGRCCKDCKDFHKPLRVGCDEPDHICSHWQFRER